MKNHVINRNKKINSRPALIYIYAFFVCVSVYILVVGRYRR